MRNAFFVITLLLFSQLHAQHDTLRHYTPGEFNIGLFGAGYHLMARFDLPGPGYATSTVVWLDGDKGATAKVALYGHEWGTPRPATDLYGEFFPQYLDPMTIPITVTKQEDGLEAIAVDWPDSVWLANNQCFVGVYNITGNAEVVQAGRTAPVPCSSTSGGNLNYQFRAPDGGGLGAVTSNNPLWVDLIFHQPIKQINPLFTDVTSAVGLDASQSNRAMAAADWDGDDDIDLLIRGQLFEQENGTYTNVTAIVGLSGTPRANLFVDMDNDGDLDILLLGTAGTSTLYEQTAPGQLTTHNLSLPSFTSIHGVSMGDLNGDHLPDLFVCQLWATYPTGEPNYLFFNDGNLDFTDETTRLYTDHNGTHNYPNNPPQNGIDYRNRRSRGSIFTDFDNDGDLDLYVTNYFLEPDEFYRNNGNGTFSNIAASKNIDRNPGGGSNHGTGIDAADYDNDGDMDLLSPQFAHPAWAGRFGHRGTTIYENSGAPSYNFTNRYGQTGIEMEETHAGGTWGDVNNDGLMDFFITTYYGCRFVDLYLQKPDHTFELATWHYGLDEVVSGTDALWVDVDQDGRLDLLGGSGNRVRLWHNEGRHSGSALQVSLRSTSSNAFGLGAQVKVYADGLLGMQEVTAGRGQNMQKPYRLHFGLGRTTQIDSVVVHFLNGSTVQYTGVDINAHVRLFENGQVEEVSTLAESGDGVTGLTKAIPQASVFPNPFSSYLVLERSEPSIVKVRLIDLQGKIVWQGQLQASMHQVLPVGNNTPKGLYLLQWETDEGWQTKRVVKQ